MIRLLVTAMSAFRIWPIRSGLLMLTIANMFFLFGLLHAFSSGTTTAVTQAHAERLYVLNRTGPSGSLPIAMLDAIGAVPGALDVSYGVFFGGYHGTDRKLVTGFAVDPTSFFSIYNGWHVLPANVVAMSRRRDGAIIGRTLANRFGWRIGDRLTLSSPIWQKTDGSRTWDFSVVGIYDTPQEPERSDLLLINYGYLDAARNQDAGSVGAFLVRASDAAAANQLAARIDQLFDDSPNRTRTVSEQEFAQQQVSSIGDIAAVVDAVTVAAFAALLLTTSAVIFQTNADRRKLFGTLMALGFTRTHLNGIVLVELLAFFILGSAIGLGLAQLAILIFGESVGLRGLPIGVLVSGPLIALGMLCCVQAMAAIFIGRLVPSRALAGPGA